MNLYAPRSLALDLHRTDLDDSASLTKFVVDHTIAPARQWWRLPPPAPNEGRDYLIESVEQGPAGMQIHHMRNWRLEESTRAFDPLARALLLFGWLFPQCFGYLGSVEAVLEHPGTAVLSDSTHLLRRPYDAVADLVAGLFGVVRPRPFSPGDMHNPARNDAAMTELRRAKSLIGDALAPIDADPDTQVIDIGLDRIDWSATDALDDAMRRDVRRRIVWFATMEVFEGDQRDSVTWRDRGVFAANVPESLTGLIALDFSEQLGHDRTTGRCARCGHLMAVEGRQRSLVRAGKPVYHPECRLESRRAYWRTYSHRRYASHKAESADPSDA